MPDLSFVLPHWMYWCGLVCFPLMAMFLLRGRRAEEAQNTNASYGIAYFLLATAGFLGMHRIYLRDYWGLLFIPVFIALLLCNATGRDTREGVSSAGNEIAKAEYLLERAQKRLADGQQDAEAEIDKQAGALADARQALLAAEAKQAYWTRMVRALALLLLAGILLDAVLIPGLKRRCDRLDAEHPPRQSTLDCAMLSAEGGKIAPENNLFAKGVGRLNNFCGGFVAYWSVIAVIVYYYEVIARYVFNSPTNWAHESMFLMFGAQYLIAGGFCLREQAHVRVDVFYARFSRRARAAIDLLTSAFFFIFVITLLVTGWTFFKDSFSVREVSFTEWGIQYYPIKLSIAAGALLLLLQGVAQLLNDINTLRGAERHGT